MVSALSRDKNPSPFRLLPQRTSVPGQKPKSKRQQSAQDGCMVLAGRLLNKILLTSTTVAVSVSVVLFRLSSHSLKAPVKPETGEARGGAKGKQGANRGKKQKETRGRGCESEAGSCSPCLLQSRNSSTFPTSPRGLSEEALRVGSLVSLLRGPSRHDSA